jgi:hypothetical protein
MPIEFNCPNCFKGYRVADSSAGKRAKCKDCGAAMTVPETSGLSFAEGETGQHKRPGKRHSSTKILPADRPAASAPKGPLRSISAGVQIKRNISSDTVKLDKPPAMKKGATATSKSTRQAGSTSVRQPKKPEPAKPSKPESELPATKAPSGLRSPGSVPRLKSTASQTRAMPEAPKKRMPNFVLMLGAAAMIGGFFLPWFDPGIEGFEPLAGFMLPLKANDLVAAIHAGNYLGDNAVVNAMNADKTAMFAWFALYLLPILPLYAVIDDLRSARNGKSHWWIRILAALPPLLAAGAIYFAFRAAFDEFFTADGFGSLSPELEAIGPGAYATVGGWVVVLLAVVIAPKVKKPPIAPIALQHNAEEGDVPDVSAHVRPKLPSRR